MNFNWPQKGTFMHDRARTEQALKTLFDTLNDCSGIRFEYHLSFPLSGEEVHIELSGPEAHVIAGLSSELRDAIEHLACEAAEGFAVRLVAVSRDEVEAAPEPVAQASKRILPIPPFSAAV